MLFLHVLGAIVAFGPTFAYSIIRGDGRQRAAARQLRDACQQATGQRLVYPLAILQGVTGVAIILIGNIPVISTPWLLLGITCT